MTPRRPQISYTLATKRQLLMRFDEAGVSSRKFWTEHGIPRSTWKTWLTLRAKLVTTTRNKKRATLGGQGAKSIIPFQHDLLTFMKDVRRDEHILTSMHMINFMKTYHKAWLDEYTAAKPDPYKSLLRLCQSFAKRHRFSQRVPCFTKQPEGDLLRIRDEFAADFWNKYKHQSPQDIINADETAVYYDMPPGRIWAEIGKSSKVDKTQKHSDRITAVLSCSKLPIFFIVHGTPGGMIDMRELRTYPDGQPYDVQESGWMDARVWRNYLDMLQSHILGPTVVLVDNFDAHVTQQSKDIVATDLFSVLEPLPANCTSVCQPLDVGVMGPFKKIMRMLWLEEVPVRTAPEKRLAMIKRSIKAWEMITNDAVKKSFVKALPEPI
ncbi:hypothetical protein DYB38_002975 [Aphanomyces astaci]|uniref:DDE-1 domain-containing protein n=1 Tax=Aphanomyces astaci TaxID=112090 RepID=A0A397C155_APHAT|nr:hypothetical protein DYB38_002975 [Aphanomyces astaci]